MSDTFNWATDANHPAGAEDWSGQPNKVAPTSGRRDEGWPPTTRMSAENLNYIFNEIGAVTEDIDSEFTITNDAISTVAGDLSTFETETGDNFTDLEVSLQAEMLEKVRLLQTQNWYEMSRSDGFATALAIPTDMMGITLQRNFQVATIDAKIFRTKNLMNTDRYVWGNHWTEDIDLVSALSWTSGLTSISNKSTSSATKRLVVCAGAMDQVAISAAVAAGWNACTSPNLNDVYWKKCASANSPETHIIMGTETGTADIIVKGYQGDIVPATGWLPLHQNNGVDPSVFLTGTDYFVRNNRTIPNEYLLTDGSKIMLSDGYTGNEVDIVSKPDPGFGALIHDFAYDYNNDTWLGVLADGTRIKSASSGQAWSEDSSVLPHEGGNEITWRTAFTNGVWVIMGRNSSGYASLWASTDGGDTWKHIMVHGVQDSSNPTRPYVLASSYPAFCAVGKYGAVHSNIFG